MRRSLLKMARRRDVRNDDRMPLLAEEGEVKRDVTPSPKKEPLKDRKGSYGSDWDPTLPYGGKVYLPRRKLDDPLWVKVCEVGAIIFVICFASYAYFYFDNLHFHITNGYAHLGYAVAQHQVGQRHLHGVGTDKDPHKAMDWFKKAADQGHPHASYNLAIGHLKGIRTDLLEKGEPHKLIQHAASKGVKEAHRTLNDICTKGGCEG